MKIAPLAFHSVVLLVGLGCAFAEPTPTDDWAIAEPAAVGLKAEPLARMRELVADHTYKNIHCVLVARKGKLAVEDYFAGTDAEGTAQTYDRERLHTMQSASKSVNSILLGIAIDQHAIASVDVPLATFFPGEAACFTEPGKQALKLRDFLTMSAGLRWTESGFPYTDPRNDAYGLNRSQDPVHYVLSRPLEVAANTKWLYNSGCSIVLGEVLHQSTGAEVTAFAEKNLFGPLGITSYRWGRLPNGVVHTGGGLFLRPRDMAKIGQLFLDGGRWQGKQIVSEAWVRESTRQQAPYRGYGYQWWLRSFRLRDHATDVFSAQGLGGQFIIVLPEVEMVAVFTGWNIGAATEQPFEMLQQYVLPAVE